MTISGCFTAAIAAVALLSQSLQSVEISSAEGVDVAVSDQVIATASPSRKTLENLEPFLDGVISGLLESHKLAGVTVAVVYDGEIAFAKGYGYADAARLTPVDPDATLFRSGSISKTFTWTAVMQLVEQGKLDLDTDVNEYLTQFQIPEAFGAPVTLRHILSHTAGFEDGGVGYLFADGVDELKPMAEFLEEHMPARVRAPGTYAAYSNWAAALTGLIVANQSGVDFDTYIEKNIFDPLGMTHSTFREPLPENIAELREASFTSRGGEYVDAGPEYIHNFAAAGSMSTTAADMARFMLAHLGDGSYEGGRILSPEMTKQMRQPLHRQHEVVDAMRYGFIETTVNGRFTYGHTGGTRFFGSDMTLAPEEGVGIFISATPKVGSFNRAIKNAFFDRYFPPHTSYPHPDPVQPDGGQDGSPTELETRFDEYVGAYRFNQRPYTDYQALLYSLPGDFRVAKARNGGIIFMGQRFIEEKKDVFVSVDNPDDKVVFDRNEDGSINYIFKKSWVMVGAERIGFWELADTYKRILGFGLLISIGVVLGSIWAFPKWVQMKDGEKLSRVLVFAASGSFLAGTALMTSAVSGGKDDVILHGIRNLHIILTLFLVGALLTLAALPAVGVAWVRGYWSLFGRLRHTAVVIILLAMAWSLYYWNLVGPWNA